MSIIGTSVTLGPYTEEYPKTRTVIRQIILIFAQQIIAESEV
jgi:hypothetical protein